MNKVFLTVNDVALLTGLKENSVFYNIKRGKYEIITIPGKGQGGKQYYISLESLPEEAQERYKEQQSSPAPLSIFSEEIMKKYSLKQRDMAIQRYNILKEWERSGLNGQSFVRKYNEEHSDKLTYRKLEYWKQKERESGIVGLIDKRGGDFRQSDCMPPEAWEIFCSMYLTPQERSIKFCYDKTKAFFKKVHPEIKFPSYSTFVNKVQNIHEYELLRCRKGKKAFEDKLPYMERDTSDLSSNSRWISDHHLADVLVKNKCGKVIRPCITAFQDEKSRKIVACIVRDSSPNTTRIKTALKQGIAEYGIPKAIYTDNGKDYLSSGLESVLNVLGIEQNKAKPYHGQSKAIERFFRTFEERFGKCFYSYIGSDGKKRPEHLKKTNKELEKDPKIPSIDEYEKHLANYIKEYNATPHHGTCMNGRTPDEVYFNSFTEPAQMISDEAVLTMLFANSCECKVSNSGVIVLGHKFESKELLDLLGKKVIVKYDPEKLDKAYIFTMDGNFYCKATPKVRSASRDATEDDFRKAKNKVKHSDKLSRENEPYRKRDVSDVMFAAIAEEHFHQIKQAEEFENIHTKKAAEAVSEQEKENFNPYSSMYDTFKKKGVI